MVKGQYVSNEVNSEFEMSDRKQSKIGQSEIIAVIIASISIAILLIVSSIAQEYINKYKLEIALISTVIIVIVLLYMLFNFSKRTVLLLGEKLEENRKKVQSDIEVNREKIEEHLLQHKTAITKKVSDNKESLKVSKKLMTESKESIIKIENTLKSVEIELRGGSSTIMTWNTLWKYVVELVDKIKDDESFKVDIVVSIGRSGSVIGSLIAGNLNGTPHIAIDRISDFKSGSRRIKIIPSLDSLKEELKGKNILCVMSECDSGRTLNKVKETLVAVEGIEEERIRTAVLFRDIKSEIIPDYIAAVDTPEKGLDYTRKDFPFRTKNWPRTSRVPTPSK